MSLNAKELARVADGPIGRYVVTVRPWKGAAPKPLFSARSGRVAGYCVALVVVLVGEPRGFIHDWNFVANRCDIGAAARDLLRWVDKVGGQGGQHASKARLRPGVKPQRLTHPEAPAPD